MYCPRIIDSYLSEWASRKDHKPLLLRGARQVGKSTAVRHLAESFESYVEINFEKQASYIPLFQAKDIDVKRIVALISAMAGKRIIPGETLLFLDKILACPEAIMSLWFFKEDLPELHVVAAGSLLEFALDDLPSFGVGRIHLMFLYPMTFDEFLMANGEQLLLEARNGASSSQPLPQPLYEKLVGLTRTFLLVGGMPEAVAKWVETHDYLQCQETHILPFEVKSGIQGGMKSLWDYMRERDLTQAIRCSLENFGEFDYIDDKADDDVRHVRILPLYAIRMLGG